MCAINNRRFAAEKPIILGQNFVEMCGPTVPRPVKKFLTLRFCLINSILGLEWFDSAGSVVDGPKNGLRPLYVMWHDWRPLSYFIKWKEGHKTRGRGAQYYYQN